MKPTLRQVLLLLVLFPALTIALLVSLTYLVHGTRELDRAFAARGEAVVSFLAPAAEFGVMSGSRVSLDSLARAVLDQPDVAAVGIFDRDGRILVVSGKLQAQNLFDSSAQVKSEPLGLRGDRMVFSSPVHAAQLSVEDFGLARVRFDLESIGWVQVELSTGRLERDKRRLLATVLIVTGLVLFLAVWMAANLSGKLTQSFGRLAWAVNRIAGGDLETSIRVDSGIRELQTLQLGFNRMARSIADSQHELQTRIDEATSQLAHLAMHDALTGLPNRRAFELALEDAVARSRRAGDRDALCFIDLDRFKQVNDSGGHAAGDALLRRLGELICNEVRTSDRLYRIGGDEFVLMLHGCDQSEARRVAENLCKVVSAYVFDWQGKQYSVGASIGLVRIEPDAAATDILRAADKACYQAKAGGRSQVFEACPEKGG